LYRNTNRIAREIFCIEDVSYFVKVQISKIRQSVPTYIGSPYALFPVGGGASSEYETVYTAFRSKGGVYWNYDYPKYGFMPKISLLTYVINEKALSKFIPQNEHERFPCVFPMRIMHSNLPNMRLYLHQNTGLVANKADTLVAQALMKTRPLGTLAVPGVALALFIGSYALYAINKYSFPTLYREEPHPTNIIKKILNN
jgi:hypothetical protein